MSCPDLGAYLEIRPQHHKISEKEAAINKEKREKEKEGKDNGKITEKMH